MDNRIPRSLYVAFRNLECEIMNETVYYCKQMSHAMYENETMPMNHIKNLIKQLEYTVIKAKEFEKKADQWTSNLNKA